jgi:hypothetical protein
MCKDTILKLSWKYLSPIEQFTPLCYLRSREEQKSVYTEINSGSLELMRLHRAPGPGQCGMELTLRIKIKINVALMIKVTVTCIYYTYEQAL